VSVATASARTFRSLRRHYNYRLYFSGQLVSVTGSWVQTTAQAWLIVELTHSAIALGALALFQYLPYSALGLLGGPLVDRFNKRVTIVITQSAFMLSAALLAVLAFAHLAEVWEVYALAVLNGTVQVVDTPARQAFVYEMVGRSELPNAVALNSSMFNAARAVGPALAGVLIAGVGVAFCFALNSASYLAVIGSLLLMRRAELYATGGEDRDGVLRSAVQGLRWTLSTRAAWLTIALLLVITTFAINFSVLLPALASQTLHSGPVTFGIITASFGVGALIGALFSASRARPSWRLLLGGAGLFSMLLLILAPMHWVFACGAVLMLTGIAYTVYTSSSNSTVQLAAPDHLRGRAMAVYFYAFNGTAPLGGLLAGWLAEVGGTQLAFAVAGGASLSAVAAAALVHSRGWGGSPQAVSRDSRSGEREPAAGRVAAPAPARGAAATMVE